MKKAFFQFSPELGVFLKISHREIAFDYEFNGPQSVKHLIEAAGVPHTEVGLVCVNGDPVSFDYQVRHADQVEVLAFSPPSLNRLSLRDPATIAGSWQSNSLDASERSNPSNPRFILDNHLGKLASHLRMLGFDCLYRNSFQDDELAQIAQDEGRILLTRDHRLLMRKTIIQGYWLRFQNPRQQLQEVVIRYSLANEIKPFQRCMRCNQLLEPVPKEAILHRLQPLTKIYFEEFRLCPNCGQIYWQGSHYTRMLAFIQNLAQVLP